MPTSKIVNSRGSFFKKRNKTISTFSIKLRQNEYSVVCFWYCWSILFPHSSWMGTDANSKIDDCSNSSVDKKDVPYGFRETWLGKNKHLLASFELSIVFESLLPHVNVPVIAKLFLSKPHLSRCCCCC